MSDSFKIEPVCASIILTGSLNGFSILCMAPLGINIVSFALAG